ncbi:MAG: FtsH protease activity modulator HflK [Planctomycetes bacterium]|nr:FtsH protease activity modulator HflK [Planctomycetota bacterium]
MIKAQWMKSALAVIVVAGLLWSSVWTVAQDETGIVMRFGGVARTVPSGIHFTLPWPLESMLKTQTSLSRTMPVGFTYVEELSGQVGKASTREWLTGDTNIVKMEVTLFYTITNPVDYLYGASDLGDGTPRNMMIRRVAESVMTNLVASMGVDEALSTGKVQLRNKVLTRTQELLDQLKLGVTLTAFNLQSMAPPPEVQDAFNEVTSAKSYREQQFSEADGARATALPYARSQANRILQEAESYRTDLLGKAAGEAASFKKLASSLKANRDVTMHRFWLESVERILGQRRAMVLPPVPKGETQTVFVDMD